MLTFTKMLLLITLSSTFAALTSEIDAILPEPESTFVETQEGFFYSSSACTAMTCCTSCDLVACGYCQERCPPSPCTAEDSTVDKPGSTSRNECATIGDVWNAGAYPQEHCRAAAKVDDTRRRAPVVPVGGCKCVPAPVLDANGDQALNNAGNKMWTRCQSCDEVPWGKCQQGCKYKRSKDQKVTNGVTTTRNDCNDGPGMDTNNDYNTWNYGQYAC